jgi:hypothetical protein
MAQGGCQCGAIRYETNGEPLHHALCHCEDCRKSAGAPMVAWMMFPADRVTVTQGEPTTYASSEHARRQFCGQCGTGMFYQNAEMLPGMTDVQSATLDDPEAIPPGANIQTAERLAWVEKAHQLPNFERYPQG